MRKSDKKTIEDYFRDWESYVFGYGYGSGEHHTIPPLRRFLELCDRGEGGGGYDFKVLEAELGPATVWFLINILCHADVIEYGTSPRYGWLTRKGETLKDFVLTFSAGELIAFVTDGKYDNWCYPNSCNCGPKGYEEGRVCQNPFWL
jgi:hypothetical protein